MTKLYIDDDLPLPQLIIHMERGGFRATKNMYKKRLLAWNLRKNYRRREKQAVLAQLEEQGEDAIRDLQVHGKPIMLGRVRRFEREERNTRMAVPVRLVNEDTWAMDDEEQHRPIQRRRRTYLYFSTPSTLQMEATNNTPGHVLRSDPHTEHILHLICTLYDDALMREFSWHQFHQPDSITVTQRDASRDTRSGWPPAAWVDIGLALHYLSAGQSVLGFWYLDRACQEIMSSLSDAKDDRLVEFHSMADIVDLFCDPTWDAFPDLRRHLLMYLMRLAGTKEGQSHPLTELWSQFRDRSRLVTCRDVLQRRLNGGFDRKVGVWRIRLRCQWGAREPQQLLYGHSQWRWEGEVVE